MSTQRLNITLPGEVSEILKTKKNKSEFLAEAVRKKDVNDRKREVKEKAAKLIKYYEHVGDPKSIISFDSQDFVD